MSDIRMTRIFLETEGQALRQQARRERLLRESFASDGTLKRSTLALVLPWQRVDWDFATVATGTNVGRRRIPQGGRVELLTIDAGNAPSTGTCTFVLNAGGQTETIALPKGATANASSNVGIVVPPGGVLTLDCLNDGGAQNVTVTAFLSAYGGA